MKTKLSLHFIICTLLLALSKAFPKASAFKARALCSVLCALCSVLCALSQTPQGFTYQAIAKDAGSPIANQALPVKISVMADSLGTAIIWQELHSSVSTNSAGLFTLILGKGSRQAASTVAKFSDIDWSMSPKFIRTEIDYGGWTTIGTTRFWSVPYALRAKDVEGPVKKLGISGTTASLNEALFEVKNRDGQTVFAVYNEGVRVYVSNGSKGLKGGFAVGGFGTESKAESTKYLFVDKDSVRIYLDTNTLTKGKKGTFAVGGYDLTKGVPQEYLRVTEDSTRIYVNNNPAKGLKGGFAVGGFNVTKGPATSFTSLTPKNYFIGHEGGQRITSGQFNSVIGYQSGKYITSGESNAFLGYQSGYSNSSGTGNLFLGYQSGFSTTTGNYNSFVGYKSGHSNTSGLNNSFVGSFSGTFNDIGSNNTFVGFEAGYSNVSGSSNNFFGTGSGRSNLTGSFNTFIGPGSGFGNSSGSYNIFIGFESGANSSGGTENVFLGYQTGFNNNGGTGNNFIGHHAGYSNQDGISNLFVGFRAGYSNIGGDLNIFLGNASGEANTTGGSNVFLGTESGKRNISGTGNVFLGRASGFNHLSGDNNVVIGYSSFHGDQTGTNNTIIGAHAGEFIEGKSNNVFIGYQAGNSENNNNRLVIGNSETSKLIHGDFAANTVVINTMLGVNIPIASMGSANFQVNGTTKLGSYGTSLSDIIRVTHTSLGFGDISGDSSVKMTIPVTGAATGASVMISPRDELPDGLVISYARIVSANNVEVKLQNTKSSTVSYNTSNLWYVTVIQ